MTDAYEGLAPAARAVLAASGERIVVTGASGWLGLATLDLLRDALGPAFGERVVAFGSARRRLGVAGGVVQHPLPVLADLPRAPTRVLHFAFPTRDRAAAMADADYVRSCAALRGTVLRALDPIGARGLFVASSGAAGLADDPQAPRAMRCYGAAKRDDEAAFAGWAGANATRAVVARIFNLAGPHINKPDAYALASFIRDAQAGRAIAVHAPHAVVRGYVAVRELVSLALVLTLTGKGVTRFETGGEALELAEVARLVGEPFGVPVARAPITQARADRYVGDAAGYAALLAASGIPPVDLRTAIRETAAAFPYAEAA